MGSIAEKAFYSLAGQFCLYFLLLPAGLLFAGYILFIIVSTLKELRKK